MQGNLSLPELAARYHISDIYGATIAYFSSKECGRHDLRAVTDRICCYELNLIIEGTATVTIGGTQHLLGKNSLLLLTPYQPVSCDFSPEVVSEGLLIDRLFYDMVSARTPRQDASEPGVASRYDTVYQLTSRQADELSGIFQQIKKTINYKHLYKQEMLSSLVHICNLYISELPFDLSMLTPDFRHKENIYKTFLHLLENNFRHERQIPFYANKLNITTTYLSRVVKSISGNTVNEHLIRRVFHEACNLLKTTDRPMGEIAFELGFKDQSAFTNFFKLHAGKSPTAYRQSPTEE